MAGEYGESLSARGFRRLLRGDESDDMIDGTGSVLLTRAVEKRSARSELVAS